MLELEVLLREHSQKMRILSSPAKLSGAHMVFEKGIAIRIYYPNDISILDDQEEGGTDGMFEFCMSFQWPMVFFVVPNISHAYPEGSFLDRAMTMAYMENVAEDKSPPRLLLVANTAQLLSAFFTFCDDVTSTVRRETRSKIIRSMMQSSFHENDDDLAGVVAAAIRNLLGPPHCPMGEAEIVLRHFDTLYDIVYNSSIGGDNAVLDQLPIERRTKQMLKAFFTNGLEQQQQHCDWRGETNNDATTAQQQQVPNTEYSHLPLGQPVWHEERHTHSLRDPLLLSGPQSALHNNYHGIPRGSMMESSATAMPHASYAPQSHMLYPPMQSQPLAYSRPIDSFDPRIQSSRNWNHRPIGHLQQYHHP
jgi:hypothetical protein